MKVAKDDACNLDLQTVSGDQGDTLTAEVDDSHLQAATVDAKQRIRLAGASSGVTLEADRQ